MSSVVSNSVLCAVPVRKPSSGSSSGRQVAVPTTPTRAAVLTKQASSSSVLDTSAGSSGVSRPAGTPAEKQPLMAYDWYWSRITRLEVPLGQPMITAATIIYRIQLLQRKVLMALYELLNLVDDLSDGH